MTARHRPLLIEFDGEGVSPGSLEPLSALQFAHAYLLLLQKLAQEDGHTLQFHGLTVEDKCAAVSTIPSSMTTADRVSARAGKLIRQPSIVPPSLEAEVRSVLDARDALPAHYTAMVIAKRKRPVVPTEWPVANAGRLFRESMAMRATVMSVGGKSSPKVKFDSIAEERPFTLKTTRDTAKRIARFLYEELDIVAIVDRDESERIADGELTEFHELQSGDSIKAWDDWYEENNQGWSDVDNVEKELGRDGYGLQEAPPSSTH